MDGIWGGNMYAGGAGAILPNKITSKHNIRYIPNMDGLDIVKKIRAQLDRNGYKDVQMKLIGDVPWSKMSYDTDIARADHPDVRTVRNPARRAVADAKRSSPAVTGRRIYSPTARSDRRWRRFRCRSPAARPDMAEWRTPPTSILSSKEPAKCTGWQGRRSRSRRSSTTYAHASGAAASPARPITEEMASFRFGIWSRRITSVKSPYTHSAESRWKSKPANSWPSSDLRDRANRH